MILEASSCFRHLPRITEAEVGQIGKKMSQNILLQFTSCYRIHFKRRMKKVIG